MVNINPLEKEIQLSICKYLAVKKYFFWRQNTQPIFDMKGGGYRAMPKYSMNGIPDIILIKKDGKFCGLEVKRPAGVQSDAQFEFQKLCILNNAEYHIVTSIDDVQKIGL